MAIYKTIYICVKTSTSMVEHVHLLTQDGGRRVWYIHRTGGGSGAGTAEPLLLRISNAATFLKSTPPFYLS